MKTLLLVRHAKSSWDDPSKKDFDRPLNKRGLRDAPFMGKLLAEQGELPDVIITSPARRAVSTARLFAEAMKIPPELIRDDRNIYTAGPDDLLNVVREIDDSISRAMVVGHNPAMAQLAGILSEGEIQHMPTCSIVALEFSVPAWRSVKEGGGKMKFFETPKKHFD